MFYATYKESKTYLDEIRKKKREEKKKKKIEEEKQKKNNLRMSSILSCNYKKDINTSLNIKKSIDDLG